MTCGKRNEYLGRKGEMILAYRSAQGKPPAPWRGRRTRQIRTVSN